MHLKRIEIQGFKSFADKTVIDIEKGITAIVGPNGSGKSNISDSIRWVLGEQRAKILRGSKMEDIIFAGTVNRKPLGFAEITLILDNTDGEMPIDFSEVSVTRRVFRSGESEYYINKTSCRLKDLRELFMDTGVGTEGYSIIGQGKIDDILSTKSEDRRKLFEEAAGIVKYKVRKVEAEKKLNKTEDNLIRIEDILLELKSQIEPLRKQSEKANTYKTLSENLKEKEVNLFVRDIDGLKEKDKQLAIQVNDYFKVEKEKEEERKLIDFAFEKIKKHTNKLDEEIEIIQKNKSKVQSEKENSEKEIAVMTEKKGFLKRETERLLKEIESLKENIKTKEALKQELKKREIELKRKVEELEKEFLKIEDKNKAFIKNIEEKETEIENKKAEKAKVINKISEKNSKVSAYIEFEKTIDSRKKQIELSKNDIKKELGELSSKINELNKDKQEIDFKTKELNEELELVKKEIEELKSKEEKCMLEVSRYEKIVHSETSKLNMLKDMQQDYEGYYKSVKNTLKACKRDLKLGSGIEGTIAEIIEVDEKYEKAIEVALGGSIQNIIANTSEEAKKVIEYLKKNKLGRVTFLPLDIIKPRSLNSKEEMLLTQEGIVGVASEVITFDEKYKNAIKNLLGRVIIAENMDFALKVAKKSNYSLKIVTLDGDILNPGGSMTGGSLASKNTSIIARERNIKELNENLNKDKKELAFKKEELVELKSLKEKAIKELNATNEDKNAKAIKLGEVQNSVNHLENNILNLKNRLISVEKEESDINKEEINSKELVKNSKKEILILEEKQKHIDFVLNDLIEEFELEKQFKETAYEELTDIKIKRAACNQEIKESITSFEKLNEEINSLEKSIEDKSNYISKSEEDNLNIDVEIEKAKKLLIQFEEKVIDTEANLKSKKESKTSLMEDFYKKQEDLEKVNNEASEVKEKITKLEIKLAQNTSQIENLKTNLYESYELSYDDAKEKYLKEFESISKVRDEVSKLKKEIKKLGNVNLDSIEEYVIVKERYEFMQSQHDDLKDAKESLIKVINDMEKTMREQFIENFEKIRVNFAEVFKALFGGGKADVYLQDEKDILSCGIEIIAQPPGKKLQNISLLSGGEKALTAIAILFAILKLKPTPFCILDEIEAALDDANVYKFADYLKDFSNKTQFVIITHRKGTMEAADTLYGVTMQQEGVSKLVSVKLSDKIEL